MTLSSWYTKYMGIYLFFFNNIQIILGSSFFPYNFTCKLTWQFSMHSHSISFDIKDLSHPRNHISFHLNFTSRTFACLIKSGMWRYSDKTHINRVFILRVKQSAKHFYQICIGNTPVWFSFTKCILVKSQTYIWVLLFQVLQNTIHNYYPNNDWGSLILRKISCFFLVQM